MDPLLEPFAEIPEETAMELLHGIKNNFAVFRRNDNYIFDYSKHLDLYQNLLKYCCINGKNIMWALKQGSGYMTYGLLVEFLLIKITLKKDAIYNPFNNRLWAQTTIFNL